MGAPVSKAKAAQLAAVHATKFRPDDHVENMHTPLCSYCDQSINILEDAICLIPGQWMADKTTGGAMFVLEPDVEVQVMQLSNGQMALRADAHTAKHVHAECHQSVCAEVFDPPWGADLDSEEDYQR